MKYKDTNNKVHEIEDGFQHLIPNWPNGYTEIADEEAAALLAPPPKTLSELKTEKVNYINQKASAELAQITSAYPKDEVATWPNQLEDAKAWQVDPLATLSILPQIALAAGITVDELAVRVLALSAQFNNISGAIIGKRKALTKQVALALTSEELDLIIW